MTPSSIQQLFSAALRHHQAGQVAEAEALYRQVLAQEPNHADSLQMLGIIFCQARQFDIGIDLIKRAVALNPRSAEALANLGTALMDIGRMDEAIEVFLRAIALKPRFPEAHNNLGSALQQTGRVEQAIAALRQAVAADPAYPDAHLNLALGLLLSGQLREGWREFEWRWKCTNCPVPPPNFPQPQWDGSVMSRGTLLITAEQGFGDMLQFVRFVPMVAQRCQHVFVTCPTELRRLLQPMLGTSLWIVDGHLPPFDAHCPIMSVPNALGTNLETIPNSVPYVHADPQATQHWRQRASSDPNRLKIGLVWAGRPAHTNDRYRSIPFSVLAPLFSVPGVSIYSLQKGDAAQQARNSPGAVNLIDWTHELNDFADTAALIANLDLVVCVDTAVAHLAGAMGRPVWTLLPFMPEWRWLQNRSDSPWYPSMRLFRQPALGDWGSVVTKVVEELKRFGSKGESEE